MRITWITILLLIAINAFSQNECDKYATDYIPVSLENAMVYLDCIWTDKDNFKNKDAQDAVSDEHFSKGAWIRNSWNLNEQRGALYRQFKSKGITFPEDISSIILTSFHRYANGKDIDFEGQVKAFKARKKQRDIEDEKRKKMGTHLNIGDTVKVAFSRNAVSKDKFDLGLLNYGPLVDRPINCNATGVITKKKQVQGSTIINIKVVDTYNCDSSYLNASEMIVSLEFSYNITYFNVSPWSKGK